MLKMPQIRTRQGPILASQFYTDSVGIVVFEVAGARMDVVASVADRETVSNFLIVVSASS